MESPFGKTCPWKGCSQKITKATGDVEGSDFSVRCGLYGEQPEGAVVEVEHRSHATRANGKLKLTPDPEGMSLPSDLAYPEDVVPETEDVEDEPSEG